MYTVNATFSIDLKDATTKPDMTVMFAARAEVRAQYEKKRNLVSDGFEAYRTTQRDNATAEKSVALSAIKDEKLPLSVFIAKMNLVKARIDNKYNNLITVAREQMDVMLTKLEVEEIIKLAEVEAEHASYVDKSYHWGATQTNEEELLRKYEKAVADSITQQQRADSDKARQESEKARREEEEAKARAEREERWRKARENNTNNNSSTNMFLSTKVKDALNALQLPCDVTKEQLSITHRKLVAMHHPDINPNAGDTMAILNNYVDIVKAHYGWK